MTTRRAWLGGAAGLGAAGVAGGLLGSLLPREAATAGEAFRALVVVLLEGGLDGHQVLVPTDAAYADYARARGAETAIPAGNLLTLPGSPGGRGLGLRPDFAPLLPAYQQGRLAFVANVGPLVRPVSAAAVAAGSVPAADLPLMLGSHRHQMALVQGALDDPADGSGWGGRALEALPPDLRHARAAIALGRSHRLVHGRTAAVGLRSQDFAPWWGLTDVRNPAADGTLAYRRLAQQQSGNRLRTEYGRAMGAAIDDIASLWGAFDTDNARPAAFTGGEVGHQLWRTSRLLPYLKQQGSRRHVVLLNETGYDHHRGINGEAWRLGNLANDLAAFDAAIKTAGLDNNVVTLVMSEFGRTLQTSGGNWSGDMGADHGWGNHWWLFGGAVAGGTVHGRFPSLVLGGADDGDAAKSGVLVPTTASDQVAATLVRWLGVPEAMLPEVFPSLATFATPTLPLLRA